MIEGLVWFGIFLLIFVVLGAAQRAARSGARRRKGLGPWERIGHPCPHGHYDWDHCPVCCH